MWPTSCRTWALSSVSYRVKRLTHQRTTQNYKFRKYSVSLSKSVSAFAERGNGPKCWKTFQFKFFACAQQCSCSQRMKVVAIFGKSWNKGIAYASIFDLPEPYKTFPVHIWPCCEHEGGQCVSSPLDIGLSSGTSYLNYLIYQHGKVWLLQFFWWTFVDFHHPTCWVHCKPLE